MIIQACAYVIAYFNLAYAAASSTNSCELSGSELFYHWKSSFLSDQACTVAIVTYATSDSFSYSAFSVAINSIYAQVSGYHMRVFDDERDTPYETADDPRWNKISIIRSALDPQDGWARHCEYIMWLDSDLIVLDVAMDVAGIGARYASADIIMSKDIDTAPFVSNSGAILVRNTEWARSFLSMWWSTFDRDRCCDQNAFTWLYDRDSPSDIKAKTALLAVDTINTDFPAWKNQKPHNPVLHLAGLSSLYRVAIFKAGYETICYAVGGWNGRNNSEFHIATSRSTLSPFILKQRLPDQLGLNKQYLYDIMRNMNQLRSLALDHLLSETQGCHCDLDRSLEDSYVLVSQGSAEVVCPVKLWRRRLDDALKFDDDEKTYYTNADFVALAALRDKEVVMRQRVFCSLVLSASAMLLQMEHNPAHHGGAAQLSESTNSYQYLEAVREAASAGFEFVIALKIAALDRERSGSGAYYVPEYAGRSLLMLDQIMRLIDAALKLVGDRLPSSSIKGTFHYYKFKTLQLMAGALQHGHHMSIDPQASIALLSEAALEWEEMLLNNYHGTNYVSADPDKEYVVALSELALLLCQDSKYELGLQTFSKVIGLQQKIILGYSSIRIATEDIVYTGKISLCESFVNFGQCAMLYKGKSSGSMGLESLNLLHDGDLHALDACIAASHDLKRIGMLNYVKSHTSAQRRKKVSKRKLKKKNNSVASF